MTQDRVLLITGTRKGIGRYLAEYYVSKGLRVVGCSREPTDLEVGGYEHVCCDVSDENSVRELFGFIRQRHGHLDALINNAGMASMNHVLLTPSNTVRKIFDVNFVGAFLCCREAARLMKKSGSGRIVNFTTVATPLKLGGEAVYAASKAAVMSLTQTLAYELADFGITVNAVGPTPVDTDLIRSVPRERIDQLISRQAIKRLGEFPDIANVIDFFLLVESSFITGQVIYLGGIS